MPSPPLPATACDFWQTFLDATTGTDPTRFYEAFAFGDNESLADELAALVLSGVKRATAGAAWTYAAEGRRPPAPGDLSIVTTWAGKPLCVIETLRVEVMPFDRVGAEFAAAEGEGDGSLAYWRESHRAYFTRECRNAGREFSEAMPIACERFRVVYPPEARETSRSAPAPAKF